MPERSAVRVAASKAVTASSARRNENPQREAKLREAYHLKYIGGAAVGAALAHKGDGTLCVSIQGDGDIVTQP